jgi:hypothetical protein
MPIAGDVVSEPRIAISLYRIAKTYPPGDAEVLTAQERYGAPGEHIPEDVRRTWDALSAYDSEERAVKKIEVARSAKRRGRWLGDLVVRYDIPEGSGIRFNPSLGPGHYDIRGDVEELKRYLAADYAVV